MKKDQDLRLKFSRFEYKFYFPSFYVDEILNFLSRKGEVDPYNYDEEGKPAFYTVNSVYFDSPSFLFYRDKFDGFTRRIKVRIRSYEEDFLTAERYFFELKMKHMDRIYKDRVVVPEALVKKYVDGNFDQVDPIEDMDFLKKISNLSDFHSLQPYVGVKYKRFSFDDKIMRCKVSIDADIQTCGINSVTELQNSNGAFAEIMPGYFVLEVKFDEMIPQYVIDLIAKYNMRRDAISKYCRSIEKIYN